MVQLQRSSGHDKLPSVKSFGVECLESGVACTELYWVVAVRHSLRISWSYAHPNIRYAVFPGHETNYLGVGAWGCFCAAFFTEQVGKFHDFKIHCPRWQASW